MDVIPTNLCRQELTRCRLMEIKVLLHLHEEAPITVMIKESLKNKGKLAGISNDHQSISQAQKKTQKTKTQNLIYTMADPLFLSSEH